MSKLPAVTAWSYSRFGLYEQCPAKFKYKHLMKLPDPSGPAAERGNVIHALAEGLIKSGPAVAGLRKTKVTAPIPPELANVATEIAHLRENNAIAEQEWGFKANWDWIGRPGWFGNDVWVRVKADAVVTYDDNTGMGVDWKTGRRYDEHTKQAELTGLLMLMRYPTMVEADVRFWYVDEPPASNEMQLVVARNDVPALQKDWERKVQPMFKDKKFPPKPNRFCSWCNYSKARGGPCQF